ncbi:MAG: phytoene desaturase family protein [Myxococcales bacterium]|nr:phytoene desaturase family protein [Myxococcales bacterium]
MKNEHVIVVGAGIGGLAAALALSTRGVRVTVIDRAGHPGGKLRQVDGIDAGPTVFTMKWVFDALFSEAGEQLEQHLELEPLTLLARHAWCAGGTLDLFSDVARTADAIGTFAGAAEAKGYRAFVARSAEIYRTLTAPYITAERPSSVVDLMRRVGLSNLGALRRTMPFSTLWDALGEFFHDPRLRQLFARYATYVGSSPLQAPATLMLVSHVEQDGVWRLRGGMHELARALQRLSEARGATYRFSTKVSRLLVTNGRVTGAALENGEALAADSVVFNGDVSALASGLLGPEATTGLKPSPRQGRSLSALTWCVRARTQGFALQHHNVFFAEDSREEFEALFRRREVPRAPTVSVCAQDRVREAGPSPTGLERLLVLINAPADGDRTGWDAAAIAAHRERAHELLLRCGLELKDEAASVATAPTDFEQLFPATGGALYGQANHGSMGSFERQGARGGLPGLFLAGGSVHPGAGVPMAAISGQLCAARVIADDFGRRPGTGELTLGALKRGV